MQISRKHNRSCREGRVGIFQECSGIQTPPAPSTWTSSPAPAVAITSRDPSSSWAQATSQVRVKDPIAKRTCPAVEKTECIDQKLVWGEFFQTSQF